MKFYIYMHEKVTGPYLPGEITELFGGVSPDTLICPENECKGGRAQWRKAGLLPELAGCVKHEISEPLVKYAEEPAAAPSLKILSTDDDSNIRALLWHMLTDAGHTVEFAKDGEEVFARLAVKKYDLVILDVNMPKMNGYKVAELLHAKLSNPPKVIIFTGRDLEKERLQFVYSGADAILSKGTGNDALVRTIEGLFSGKPKKAAKVERQFVPEPVPPGVEAAPVRQGPEKLQKEEFFSGDEQEKTAPPAKASPLVKTEPLTKTEPLAKPASPAASPAPAKPVPQHMTEVEAVKLETITGRTGDKAWSDTQDPAAGRETGGKLESVLDQVFLENKALKSDLTDIRRLLGHIELEYTQLEGQFEKQALKILDKNRELAEKLESDWRKLRNYVTRILLCLLAAVLAAVFRQ